MIERGAGPRIWLLSAAGALVAVAFVALLFRSPQKKSPTPPPVVTTPPVAAVGLARLGDSEEDALLREEATMRDPTPLFLPTPWNAGEDALPPDFRREWGTSFQGYPAILVYGGSVLKLNLPPAVAVPAGPADAFATDQPRRPFAGFGQTDRDIVPLAPRGAFVEITSSADGQRVFAMALQDAWPPGEAVWQPLEFLVAVDRSGVVRPPVLTESSRVAAVDGYFGDYLVNGLHVGERLAPGFYRVAIGP